jgi:hypothetical protein
MADINELLTDPNFLNLLAGVGSRLGGPGSVAEALGAPTQLYTSSLAAQQAAAKVAQQPAPTIRSYRDVIDRLGGEVTPRGTPGPSSFSRKRDGSYVLEGDLDAPIQKEIDATLSPYTGSQAPRFTPTERAVDALVSPYTGSQESRRSLGEAPTQQELDDTLGFPTATPTPRSTQGVAGSGSAPGAMPPALPVSPQGVAPSPVSPQVVAPSSSGPRVPEEGVITARDLRGLNPDQVNALLGRQLQASTLEGQVLGLAGRDISSSRTHQRLVAEAGRREAATTANALTAAKHKAAETIAKSNLTVEQQESAFQRLDQATTLDQARVELVNAAKLPPRIVSAQEREDYSREQFGGRSYGQLTAAEQQAVNARVLREKTTFDIHATDTGLYRIDRRTGQVSQVRAPGGAGAAPSGTAAPAADYRADTERQRVLVQKYQALTPEAARVEAGKDLQTAQNPTERAAIVDSYEIAHGTTGGPRLSAAPAALVPYENLSPFAKSVSAPAEPPAFGAKPPTEAQSRALGYGSRALQAHEIITNLEKQNPATATNYRLWLAHKLDELGEWSPLKAGGAVSGLGVAAGTLGGITGTAGTIAGMPLGNVAYAIARGAAQGAARGSLIGGAIGAGVAGSVTLSPVVAGLLRTEDERQYLAAKLDFMSATLRKESGAAISVGEFVSEDKRFFPQLNDNASVIQQKERAREQAIASFQQESGRKLAAPRVAPTTPAQTFLAPGAGEDVAKDLMRQQEDLRQRLGTPGASGAPGVPLVPPGRTESFAPIPRELPAQVLPVSPAAQQRNAPGAAPKATLAVEHMPHLMALKDYKSDAIGKGAADEHLRAIGAETLAQQLSYYGPAQKAAIRSRMKKLGMQ